MEPRTAGGPNEACWPPYAGGAESLGVDYSSFEDELET